MKNTDHQPFTRDKSVVVIPAYKPSQTLIELTHTLTASKYLIIVVDDGRGSEYAGIWSSLPQEAIIIHHPRNLGKGAALKTAFQFILECMPEAGCIITMDADGQYLPSDMERVALRAWTDPSTLVLGSREFGQDTPLRSKVGNTITKYVFSFIAKTKVQDTQTGLRAFDRSLLEYMLSIDGERYEYEINVLLHCRENGIKIVDVPITTVYLDRKNSCSHFNTLRDSVRIYGRIIKFASSSLLSFLLDYFLFLLLTAVFPTGALYIVICNIVARIGSASLNYSLNRRLVFRDQRSVSKTLPQYILLAAGILAANSVILSFLVSVLGIPVTVSKLITEFVLFILSFIVQSRVIYRPLKISRQDSY